MLNNPQITGVQRIIPVLPVAGIGSSSQQLESQAAQFVQGQTYTGKVVAKLDTTTFLVQVSGQQANNIPLKMALGANAQLGQTLALQYLHNSPTMTFMLKQASAEATGQHVTLSNTGQLLGQYLKQAEAHGVPKRYEATEVVTQFPAKPQLLAQDLQHAVSKSGLFYESHLQAFAQGQATVNQLKQEPQNQAQFTPATMLFQQLAILENQRLSWHGEVWPGQDMAWDVYEQRVPREHDEQSAEHEAQSRAIASEMSLNFPNLGKIRVKLSLVDGHMRVHMSSDTPPTLALLQRQKPQLADALDRDQLKLDGITVARELA